MTIVQIGGQHPEEWMAFINYLCQQAPTSYLEVGAREGIAMRHLLDRVPSITESVAVDLPGARWGRAGSEEQLRQNCPQTDIILGDSRDESVIERVRAYDGFDVVFIDGDHSYEGVRSDYAVYAPMASMCVALHDINHPPESKAYGPTKLWDEVRDETSIEFIAEGSFKGIGVLPR